MLDAATLDPSAFLPDDEEDGETTRQIRNLVIRLRDESDPVDRQVIYLRFELGLTHQEVARICNVSRVAITKRLNKIVNRAIKLHNDLKKEAIQA